MGKAQLLCPTALGAWGACTSVRRSSVSVEIGTCTFRMEQLGIFYQSSLEFVSVDVLCNKLGVKFFIADTELTGRGRSIFMS